MLFYLQCFIRNWRSFTLRKLYICTEASVSCINLTELMYLHFPNFVFFKGTMTDVANVWSHIIIKRRHIYPHYLLLADSCWMLVKNNLPDINYHWLSRDSWRPKGAWHVRVHFCKMSGVSFACLTPFPCSLFFTLARSFVPFMCFLETPATQATLHTKPVNILKVKCVRYLSW